MYFLNWRQPFETSLLAILIAGGGTILLNVPLEPGNKLSEAVFATGSKYFRINHFNAETADYTCEKTCVRIKIDEL